MKIKQKRQLSTKKIALIVALLLLVVSACGAYFFVKYNDEKTSNNEGGVNYSKPTDEQKKAGEAAEKEAEKKDNDTSKQSPSNNNDSPSTPQKIATSVTIPNADQLSDGTLSIRTVIESVEPNPGTCTLSISQGSNVVFTSTAKTEGRSSYTACQGFDVTKAQLGSTVGQVTVSITYSGETHQGTATTQVTLK